MREISLCDSDHNYVTYKRSTAPEVRCAAWRMRVKARNDVITQVKWRCLHYFRRECEAEGERRGKVSSISKQAGGCVLPSFVQVVHNHLFSCKLFCFSFVDRQNT